MAARKRPRPARKSGGAQKEEAQRAAAAERRRMQEEEAQKMAGYMSFAEASTVTGIDKYRIGAAVKRAGVPVFRSPQDARKKFVKREDVSRLTAYTPDESGEGAAE